MRPSARRVMSSGKGFATFQGSMRRVLACLLLFMFTASAASEDERALGFEVRVPDEDDPEAFGYVYICKACTAETWESVVRG